LQATPDGQINPDGLLATLLAGWAVSFAALLLERSLALQEKPMAGSSRLQAILRAVLLSMLLPSLAAGLLLGLDWLLRLLQAGALLMALLAASWACARCGKSFSLTSASSLPPCLSTACLPACWGGMVCATGVAACNRGWDWSCAKAGPCSTWAAPCGRLHWPCCWAAGC
jgi:hypothetical protein